MKPFKSPLLLISFVSLIMMTADLSAGEITLDNGDVIHGELKAIHNEHIVWTSKVFGEINIPKANIKQFESSSVLPIVKQTTADDSPLGSQRTTETNCKFKVEGTTSAQCDSGEWPSLSLNNIVSVPLAPEPAPFTGEIKFGYNQKSGNSDSEELDVALLAHWRREKLLHEIEVVIESDKAEGTVVDEQYKTNYQLNYDLNERWFSYGRGEYEKTRFSAIDEQYQLGMGIGHRLALTNQLQLNMQIGAAYLSSKRADGSSRDKDIAGRWAMKLDWPIPGSQLKVFHRQELLWLIDEVDNNEIETSTGLKMPLLGGIFSEIRYDMDYVNEPTDGQQHADHEWVISLGYEW